MFQVSVDVGGTFTDCLVYQPGHPLAMFKASTTPADPTTGVFEALRKAAAGTGRTISDFLGDVDLFVHGTTLGTNVLLTKTGAKVGLLTTGGFRDVTEIRRGIRNLNRSMFDQFHPPYDPLVPRNRRLGVPERMRYTGEVVDPLDEQAAANLVRRLLDDGCNSIAICLLHAHVNPSHEQALKSIVLREASDTYVVCSHEILRTQGEFERFSSTIVSAYIEPAIARYLRQLQQRLQQGGFSAPLLIMQSSGLMQTVDECIGRAVELLVSGPAAAPSAALAIAQTRGIDNVIEVDMGGTSFDMCVIRNGKVPTTKDAWVGEERVAIKMVDVNAIGAGGGSIARIDRLGLLRVGPQSAGADPGPAAYGRSNLATVTDADLVLGYLSPEYFLGGEMSLDLDRSHHALSEIGKQLGLDAQETALAVFRTINSVMANGITETCTKKGHDVRDFLLVAGGGAGGLHCAAVAELLGIPEVIFPAAGALLSAMGMLTMDIGQELAKSEPWNDAEGVTAERVAASFNAMAAEALASFRRAGVPEDRVDFSRSIEMRYIGQYHHLEIAVPAGKIVAETIATLLKSFHELYEATYGYSMPQLGVEFLEMHLRGGGRRDDPFKFVATERKNGDAASARSGSRECTMVDGRRSIPDYDRSLLLSGHRFSGPALIDSATTTVLVPTAFDAEIDEHLNIVLRTRARSTMGQLTHADRAAE